MSGEIVVIAIVGAVLFGGTYLFLIGMQGVAVKDAVAHELFGDWPRAPELTAPGDYSQAGSGREAPGTVNAQGMSLTHSDGGSTR